MRPAENLQAGRATNKGRKRVYIALRTIDGGVMYAPSVREAARRLRKYCPGMSVNHVEAALRSLAYSRTRPTQVRIDRKSKHGLSITASPKL